MPAQVAVTPVPPPAVGPPADSLRLALQFEQERAKSLAARLAQSEAERRELTSRAMTPPAAAVPESIGPAPVVRPAAGRTELRAALDETQRQNDELRTRVRDLELQQLLQGQATRTTPVAVPQGPTLITTPGATSGADLAARVAALESELGEVRAQAALPRATGAADTAAGVVAARLQAIDARLATVQADLREAAAAPAAPPAPADVASPARPAPALDILLPAGTPRVFPEIEFRSGSVRVPPGAVSVLAGVAEAIRGVPEARVRIVGYTDNVGLAARNLALSRERAQAVANVLIENGVDSERLTVEGRGEESPVASNGTAAGRRLNRRVEFVRTR